MIPINVYEDNVDFCMASAQKVSWEWLDFPM